MSVNLPPITKSKSVIITGAATIFSVLYKAVDAASNAEFLWLKLGLSENAAQFLGSSRVIDFMVAVSLLGLVVALLYQTNRNMASVAVTRTGHHPRGAERLPEPQTERTPSPVRRVVVDVSPQYLMSLCEGHTAVQAQKSVELYVGKWMRVSGTVEDVSKLFWWCVELIIDPATHRRILANFSDETMYDRISVLPKGSRLEVFGQIESVRTTLISLQNCELPSDTKSLPEKAATAEEEVLDSSPIPPVPSSVPTRKIERVDRRIILDITPENLTAIYREHTGVQANKLIEIYVGKWLRVSGAVRNVAEFSDSSLIVYMLCGDGAVAAEFIEQRWVDHVVALRKGTIITVVGKLHRVDEKYTWLKECELSN